MARSSRNLFRVGRVSCKRWLWRCLAVVVLAWAPSSESFAENWPQWRGPEGNGTSGERGIATEWGREKNVAWRVAMPGAAGATPVIWGDRIFVTSAAEDDLVLLCLSTSGEELWRKRVGTGNRTSRGDEGNSASPSPTTDGKYVWTFMGTGDLGCYDWDGNEVWKFNMQDRYGRFDIQFGMTSTPVLAGDKLYLQIIHGSMRGDEEPGYVVALEKLSGKQVWKADRKTNARVECKHSYASPVLYDDGKTRFLLTHGADYAVAYELGTGKELWRHGGINPFPSLSGTAASSGPGGIIERLDTNKDGKVVRDEIPAGTLRNLFDRLARKHELDAGKTYTVAELKRLTGLARVAPRRSQTADYHPTLRFVSSPAVAPGIIVVPSAKRGPVLALRPGLSGDATDTEGALLWRMPRGTPDVPSPVIHGGLVYLCSEGGNLTCLDAASGEEIYTRRTHDQRHRSSPVVADGKIYLGARDGVVSVVKAGRTFEMLAQNDLEESLAASPVISNGTLYLRTFEALWAIRQGR